LIISYLQPYSGENKRRLSQVAQLTGKEKQLGGLSQVAQLTGKEKNAERGIEKKGHH